ncbi:MAG: HDOD domain-containing protein [Myxococcales bacterium]|nr:HDOD domain-containing protein [Myxococcales bacterium]
MAAPRAPDLTDDSIDVAFDGEEEEERALDLSPASTRIGEELERFSHYVEALKPNTHALAHIRRVLADPAASPADVARAVEKDVAIATAVLRVVNSPLYGLGQRCRSVRSAVALLGIREVANVVSTSTALTILEKAGAASPSVAAHSLAVASVARYLAPLANISADDAFTAGLLHDVGVLILLQHEGESYERWVAPDGALVERDPSEERAAGIVDHATVGAFAASRWELPAPLPDVIATHHDPRAGRDAGAGVSDVVTLLGAAETLLPLLSEWESVGDEERASLAARLPLAQLGVSADGLADMWPALRRARDRGEAIVESVDLGSVDTAPPPAEAPALPPAPAGALRSRRALRHGAFAGAAVLLAIGLGVAGWAFTRAGAGVGAEAGQVLPR